MRHSLPLLFFFVWIQLVANPVTAQSLLNPPYGLRWGDSPEKLIQWASKHQMNVTISLPGDQPRLRIVRISPSSGFLPETKASALEGRFLSGQLFELTIHYFDIDASADLIESRFEALKKQLTIEHGSFLTNQQERSVKNQFVRRTQSYHREPVQGLFLLLAFSEIEDLPRQAREARFSVIYRNDNFRKELEQMLQKP